MESAFGHDLGPEKIFPGLLVNCSSEAELPVTKEDQSTQPGSTRKAFVVVGIVFALSVLALIYVYHCFPDLEEEEKQHIKLPRDIDDAKNLGRVLYRYKDKYYFEVLTGVFVSYIFLQTFAIPGSISLSILSGFLFPFPLALVLVCFCSATGATFCYLLSFLVGRRLVYKYFPDRARSWADTVNNQRSNLLNYMIFLRITPFLPNWFINITAPVIDVPMLPFWLGTFIGVAPPSFVAIQAGTTLHQLASSGDAVSWTSITLLAIFAILSLVPVLLKAKLRDKFE
ncbi:transmembrane protein 41B isoform X1 [Neocloeon triangulifer]|uniref:transmembrane protein 41B isoform X1 n=1 Tax=Neocloeon triangulifer TaxID=2078957 RepID=UPI00286ED29B|nr:transmembrane protein 41B isoform X1 [Neocloeon triangulifer]